MSHRTSYRRFVDGAVDGVHDAGKQGVVTRGRRSHQRSPEGVFIFHALGKQTLWACQEPVGQRFPDLSATKMHGVSIIREIG